MKILVITPKFPLPDMGACEKDRLEGLLQLRRLGHEVRVVAKIFSWQDQAAIRAWSEDNGILVTMVPYQFEQEHSRATRLRMYAQRLLRPRYWDSSAYEYFDPVVQREVQGMFESWQPDVLWADYTYLWPLYHHAHARAIPVITRSINVEARHFLEEDGRSFINYLKYLPKVATEKKMAQGSRCVCAITPDEQRWYKSIAKQTPVVTLPLRGMSQTLRHTHEVRSTTPLKAYFMGSTYNVPHNRRALEFLVHEVIPRVNQELPGSYEFHIFGGKIPQSIEEQLPPFVHLRGWQADMNVALSEMDVAVIPSLYGAGMQQKIFESFARGVPSIVSPRGIAGYAFEDGRHYIAATTVDEFVDALGRLRDPHVRAKLSRLARAASHDQFNQAQLDAIVQQCIQNATAS